MESSTRQDDDVSARSARRLSFAICGHEVLRMSGFEEPISYAYFNISPMVKVTSAKKIKPLGADIVVLLSKIMR